MKSGYDVIWTDEAFKNLIRIIKYLEKNWSEKEINRFIKKLDKRINLISINPQLFAKAKIKKNIRRSVLTKHIVIYYLFENKMVKILTLFDTRQNPSKLKL